MHRPLRMIQSDGSDVQEKQWITYSEGAFFECAAALGIAVAGSGRKVILVEDDDSMRGAIERLLDAAGFQYTAYASAEALLAGSAGEDAACVVSDLKLPAMSGLDLLAELSARGGRAPLILITARDMPGLSEEAGRRGAAAYLAKPFSSTALLDAIRAAIEPGKPS